MIGLLLGLLVGLRHAFEPDHLTAVSTLVADAPNARKGAMLGAIWGLGHTIALFVVGAILAVIGTTLPARAAIYFELAVSAMLLVLGARSLIRAFRDGAKVAHSHAAPAGFAVALSRTVGITHAGAAGHDRPHGHDVPHVPHIHLGARTVAWRPLVVGLIHGLAGSGALTALVFAEIPTVASRLAYIALFGLGSVGGMAVASGAAGLSLAYVARSARLRRGFAIATGSLSIVVGILWAVPLIAALA